MLKLTPKAGSKPRVLLVITKADVGGAQMHVLQLIGGLRQHYQFILVAGGEDFLTRRVAGLGVRVKICPQLVRSIRPFLDLRACWALYKLIRRYRPTFVHTHSFKAGVVGRLAARLAGKPVIFTAHGWSFTPGTPRVQRLVGLFVESMLGRITDATINVSEHDVDLAVENNIGSGSSRYLVLNAAVPPRLIAKPGGSPVNLLTVGRLTPVKNQQLLIEAMSQLPAEVTLTIIGEGVMRPRLEQLISRYQLDSRITLKGEVRDINPFYGKAQIFVLCSNYEGLPLGILEAMAAGMPVVSTDVGGVSEAVVEGDTGLLVQRGDASGLANAIRSLLNEPDRRQLMGTQARERHGRLFTVERFVKETAAVYEQVLQPELDKSVK